MATKRASKKIARKKVQRSRKKAQSIRAVSIVSSRERVLDSRRQLIVVSYAGLEAAEAPASRELFAPAVHVSATATKAASGLSRILGRAKADIKPLFRESQLMPSMLSAPFPASNAQPPDSSLGTYQVVRAADEQLEELADELVSHKLVAAAYVKPEIFTPVAPSGGKRLRSKMRQKPAAPAPAGAATPDFSSRQGYLDSSPAGVGARWAWTQAGGKGEGVSIIDIEGGWCFQHEDLRQSVDGLVGGVAFPEASWRDHGTAVLSEMVGDENSIGVTGIAPKARVAAISHSPDGAAPAILEAAGRLNPGDIMLLEMHQPGPRYKFKPRNDQAGYIAVEWWPDTLLAVRYAVRRGIIVVSAAGNGAENLDDPLYSIRPATPPNVFPATWSNPFDRANNDSGSIIVGAGAPPNGGYGADRSRLDFSNYGNLVDAQGWGRGVVACGYGDLQGGPEERRYTEVFAGTSSASPIVVGALASIQGMRKANGQSPLTPDQARDLLRRFGAPQQATASAPLGQRIGNRPDIKAIAQNMP